ncbi:hypothetical protein, partial [Paraburkholderia sp. SIMBA_030]|uniref:hypothetical protein n=1 Tax=Paraburkholderia sp. SIMBA_030 TaxID=3085773 RepID=UPI00397BDB20
MAATHHESRRYMLRGALHRALLHCIILDLRPVGTYPNAKKYRYAVSFLVVARAFQDYFSLYKTKTSGISLEPLPGG